MPGDDALEAFEQIVGELFAEFTISDANGERAPAAVAARGYRAAREISQAAPATELPEGYLSQYIERIKEQRRSLHVRARSDDYFAEVLRVLSDDPWWREGGEADALPAD